LHLGGNTLSEAGVGQKTTILHSASHCLEQIIEQVKLPRAKGGEHKSGCQLAWGGILRNVLSHGGSFCGWRHGDRTRATLPM